MRPHHAQTAPILRSAFARYFYPPDVIVLAVRWYLRFALSYRDLEELLAERGVEVDHTTIYRWVQRFTPLLAAAARRSSTRRQSSRRWRPSGERCGSCAASASNGRSSGSAT
jgi:transposase, IS6 family